MASISLCLSKEYVRNIWLAYFSYPEHSTKVRDTNSRRRYVGKPLRILRHKIIPFSSFKKAFGFMTTPVREALLPFGFKSILIFS